MSSDLRAARIAALQRQVLSLHKMVTATAQIEQAKGILMLRYGVGPDRATDLLRQWSTDQNVSLRLVAAVLVHLCLTDARFASRDRSPEQLLTAALCDDLLLQTLQAEMARSGDPRA